MSCGTCANQAAPTLSGVGVPADQSLAVWADKSVGMTWEYLPRCPYCHKWVSPRTGICNYAKCPRKGDQVAVAAGWPPEGVVLMRRRADVERIRAYTGQAAPPLPLSLEEHRAQQAAVEAALAAAAAQTAAQVPYQRNQGDYVISDSDGIGSGTLKEKCRANIEAIKLLKRLEAEDRPATPEEQAILVKYTGWGALAKAFEHPSVWNKTGWETEHAELRALLDEEEWRSARATTPNAHYTSPEIIKGMWQALEEMGFEGGTVLEPAAGVGHFFGLCPPELTGNTTRVGVEIDSLSARLAAKIYPNATIHQTGFENAPLPNDFFDLVVSNVPFGDYGVYDPDFKGPKKYLSRSIHNYFFAKALRKVKPGGVVAFVTSRYTMDAEDPKVRAYLASQADLLGSIRLPNNAFRENAGTEVTTDIIFLRRRADGDTPGDASWTQAEPTPMTDPKSGQVSDHPLNAYYAQHPEMMLGTMEVSGTMYYGRHPQLVPIPGQDLNTGMQQAIAHLPKEGVFKPVPARCPSCGAFLAANGQCNNPKCPGKQAFKPQAIAKKNGTFVVGDDGGIYQVTNGVATDTTVKPQDQARAARLIAVRDQAREVLRLNVEGADDAELAAAQAELNRVYDEFVAQHGPLSDPRNRRLLKTDPDLPFILALENYDPETKTAAKVALFSKRTIRQQHAVERVETARDALLTTLDESGVVDWQRMVELTGLDEADLQGQLIGQVFKNPSGIWETADQYLSGDVKTKLVAAEAAAQIDPAYQSNVEALKAVIPQDLLPREINAALGSAWIPVDDVKDFTRALFGLSQYNNAFGIRYIDPLAEWQVQSGGIWSPAAQSKWGTQRMNGWELLASALNGRTPTVTDPDPSDPEGKRRVTNAAETLAAREMQAKICEEFKRWLWEDPTRAERLAGLYNDKFNRIVPRKYDGSHLTLPGMAADMPALRAHQKDAIWRVVSSPENNLLGHIVGAGKTFTMIGAGMEMRRLGKRRKVMYAVPNHMLEQFGGDFRRMYPGAKVLLVSAEDLGNAQKRAETMARVATEDWDGVVVTHSALEKLPVSDDTHNSFMRQQIDVLESYLEEEKRQGGKDPAAKRSIKEMEKAKKRLEAKIEARARAKKKDETLTWEELGVDQLFVDEAHKFKNLYFPTRRTRVAGIPQTDSARAFDMYVKTQYIQRRCKCGAFLGADGVCHRCGGATQEVGGGVCFATGTPIANTVAEMYTLQRYLQSDRLRELGLEHFDAWATQFGETVSALEMKPTGDGYREYTRFAKFVNVPELLRVFGEVADIRMDPDELGLARPTMTGGKAQTITAPPSKEMKDFLKDCAARAERLSQVSPEEDNMLKIVSDATKAALDMRLVDPSLPDNPDSKVNRAVTQIKHIYDDTTGVTLPGVEGTHDMAQVVFLDSSIPDSGGGFSVYQDLRDKLVASGIPDSQIAFIHDAKTDEAKLALFEKVNAGKVRVLIGSTEKMGSGTNVQQRLAALHHLDAPWRPADVEQREGRILRQGNLNSKVGVYRYVTEESFDVYRWQVLESKAKFIAQVTSGKMTERSAEDIDAIVVGYAEVKALATGNPIIVEKIKLESEMRKLRALSNAWTDKRRFMRTEINLAQIRIQSADQAIQKYTEIAPLVATKTAGDFNAAFGGKRYTKREEAGAVFMQALQAATESRTPIDPTQVGEVRGFPVYIAKKGALSAPEVYVRVQNVNLPIETSTSPAGNMTRLENALGSIPSKIAAEEQRKRDLQGRIKEYEAEITRPFEHQDRIDEIQSQILVCEAQIAELSKNDPTKQVAAEAEDAN